MIYPLWEAARDLVVSLEVLLADVAGHPSHLLSGKVVPNDRFFGRQARPLHGAIFGVLAEFLPALLKESGDASNFQFSIQQEGNGPIELRAIGK